MLQRSFLKDVNSGQRVGVNVKIKLLIAKYWKGRNTVEIKRPECVRRGVDGPESPAGTAPLPLVPVCPLPEARGLTFSSSLSSMRTSAGLLPGSRSTFLCRDHLHMPGSGERGVQPSQGGGGASERRPSEQDSEPWSPRSDPRPHCQVLGSTPMGVGFSHLQPP